MLHGIRAFPLTEIISGAFTTEREAAAAQKRPAAASKAVLGVLEEPSRALLDRCHKGHGTR